MKDKVLEFVHWRETIDLVGEYSLRIIGALILMLIGWKIVNFTTKAMERALIRQRVDPTLTPFLRSLTNTILKITLVISVAGMLGVKTTSFITLLGAAGLAIGLALQGSLSNFAGGVLILFFRPFKVGDVIEASSYTGTVTEIQILNTIVLTFDNQTVILPNGQLINGPIVNFTTQANRRIELVFGISYDSDIDKARYIIHSIIKSDPRAQSEPPPFVKVGALGAYSVDLWVRVWCKREDFLDFKFDLNELTKKAFDQEGIKIPFPTTEMIYTNGKLPS
ncbi:MAG: mechanosensitive ion channel protein MscS [Bdellovibrio sp. CG12_big_fil_rev_8_21_14_0_65_39_13]|nr:MAG: mechanosensitive ion channel protein MscS [Bdellovibrio sp. CG22_combo_CG10-13_8_21_14_all_39_27]PIQ61049.1 MAG: mechanosensitive ion channel protein MscS [Bdellovibrio sp. CG12_big_fil_rev_8_21_14_0_65_39_13]PIR36816.1 MAG: mechanosensitive ion channel protein MscS [Bdellovibrio sp. CG11_big_fil_rev_8_21_14_0_20_39_38]PJB52816.1 MAG: mechanosensitive ion channel protein MscS [Bdellovibrio sp. CG_4_9_14_3_um_filter_39_7]